MPTTLLRTTRSRRFRNLSVAVLAVLLLAAACGGGTDDGDPPTAEAPGSPAPPSEPGEGPLPPPAPGEEPPPEPSGDPAPAPGEEPPPPPPPGEEPPPPPAPGEEPPPPAVGSADPVPPPPAPVAAPDPVAEPVYGGTLVYGLEAETPDGWNPASTQCAVACHTVMRAIFDPLTIEGPDGAPQPYLLESFEANNDFTTWTLRMRPGITFHDGTPADANALAVHFDRMKAGTLTGQVVRRLEDWTVIDNLTLALHSSSPYAGLPALLTGQLGYLAAPSQHADPEGAANPVGTGPFAFNSWIPNQEFVADRYPGYWKTDAQGRQLPYLDRVVFRAIPDADARRLALQAGDLDVHHVNDARIANENRENHKVVEEGSFFQTTYMMLNNAKAPFDDIRARRAVAHCTDYETYNLLRVNGNVPIANGPFGPNTPGYLPDTGFPTYDPDAGRALWSELDNPGVVELGTTNNPVNLTTTELISQMWNDCGIDTAISQVDQGTLILNAVVGNFQAFLWRNHNGANLENERTWWHSEYTSGLAVNFGRIMNPRIDEALDAAARTTDLDDWRSLAETINRVFAEDVHNIWLSWSLWMLPHLDRVQNLALLTLPDGHQILNLIEGRAFLTETWIE